MSKNDAIVAFSGRGRTLWSEYPNAALIWIGEAAPRRAHRHFARFLVVNRATWRDQLPAFLRSLPGPATYWLDASVAADYAEIFAVAAKHPVRSPSFLFSGVTPEQLAPWLARLQTTEPRYRLVTEPEGVCALVPPRNYLTPKFLGHIKRSAVRTIVECGSRDGWDALALAGYFGARTYAFECVPELARRSAENAAGDPRVEVVPCAVWNRDEPIVFHAVDLERSTFLPEWQPLGGNAGAGSCHRFSREQPWFENYVQKQITVPATRLDTFCRERGLRRIDLLCMDLQGAEMHALEGLGTWIRRVKYLILEVSTAPIYEGAVDYAGLRAFLESHGFECYRECFGTYGLPRALAPESTLGDVLFVRGGLKVGYRSWARRRREARIKEIDR